MPNNSYVLGTYQNRNAVESAVRGFKDAGFSGSEVSAILPEKGDSKKVMSGADAKAPRSATNPGFAPGSEVQGAIGWLVGFGALTLPGIGPVIAVGPLIAALASVGMGGTSRGFAESLSALGLPINTATRYEQKLLGGEALVAICCESPEHCQRAREIMEITRAEDIAATADRFKHPNSTAA